MKKAMLVFAAALAAANDLSGSEADGGAPRRLTDETDAQRAARMAWWKNDRFGLFVHFGLYSLPARHEWVKSLERMDNVAYERYFRHFDPAGRLCEVDERPREGDLRLRP